MISNDLQAARAEAEATARRREAAAVKIQAAARGFAVRRKLRAAMQAARYVDEDEDE